MTDDDVRERAVSMDLYDSNGSIAAVVDVVEIVVSQGCLLVALETLARQGSPNANSPLN